MSHHNNIIIASAVIGANIGGYVYTKQHTTYVGGVIVGGICGGIFGYASPVLVPGLLIGGPGYLLAKHHSSQQELK